MRAKFINEKSNLATKKYWENKKIKINNLS